MGNPDTIKEITDPTKTNPEQQLTEQVSKDLFKNLFTKEQREQYETTLKETIIAGYEQENKQYNKNLLDKIVKSIPDQVFRYGNQKILKNLQSNPYYVPDLPMLVRWFLNSCNTLYPNYEKFAPNKLENWFKDCFPYIQAYSLNNEGMGGNPVLITLFFDLYHARNIKDLSIPKLKKVRDYLLNKDKSYSDIDENDRTIIQKIIEG